MKSPETFAACSLAEQDFPIHLGSVPGDQLRGKLGGLIHVDLGHEALFVFQALAADGHLPGPRICGMVLAGKG